MTGRSVARVDDDRRAVPDQLSAELARWAAEGRSAEAVGSRSRERWLRQQAEESATWLGVLLDLAEQGRSVVAELSSGGSACGELVGVGEDVCLLSGGAGRPTTLVALAHVAAVRARVPAMDVATGDRLPPLRLDLLGALARLAAEREPARLGLAGGREATGRILGAGSDVLTLDPATRPGSRGDRLFVPTAAVATCTPLR